LRGIASEYFPNVYRILFVTCWRPKPLDAFEVDSFGLKLTNVLTLALFAFLINPQPAAPPDFFAKNY
jgi:hypothetical protein